MPQDAVRDTVVPGGAGRVRLQHGGQARTRLHHAVAVVVLDTRDEDLDVVGDAPSCSLQEGSAATLLLFGRSSAVAASERAW